VAAVRGEAADRIRQAARSGDRAFLAASVQPRAVEARNVAALLPGSDPTLADEVLIIGAHYDHLGFGGEGSLDPDVRAVHNGADDNASGTSGLIEIARLLSEGDRRPARSVLFLAFTAEESGLWGSSHYVRNPLLPIAQTVAMLNMDMIGRLHHEKLQVGGMRTGSGLEDIVGRLAESYGIEIVSGGGVSGRSDHANFYRADIPVLFFFTGLHEQYHRPTDVWKRIDVEGMTKVATLAARTAEEMANTPTRPEFTKADGGGAGPPRPRLGVSLEPRSAVVTISATVPNGAAAKAGLQAGDVILAIAGKKTPDQRTLRRIMRNLTIGQKVKMKFRRGKRVKSVEVELGS